MPVLDRFRDWLLVRLAPTFERIGGDIAGASERARSAHQRLDQITARVETLEAERDKWQNVLQWIDDSFDRARWEITSPLPYLKDEGRREQLGQLRAMVTLNEKLGRETPQDIGLMVLALAGRELPKE